MSNIAAALELIKKTPEAVEKVKGFMDKSEKLLGQTQSWIDRLDKVFGDELPGDTQGLHHRLMDKVSNLVGMIQSILHFLGAEDSSEESEIDPDLDRYNECVQDFNGDLHDAQKGEMEQLMEGLSQSVLDDVSEEDKAELIIETHASAAEQLEAMFTEEELKEMKVLADEIYEEMFPESATDYAMRYYLDREKLDPWMKVALAPANGIESVIMGIYEFASSPVQSVEDMYEMVKVMSGMTYEEFCQCVKALKFMYEHSEKEKMAAPAISFLVGFVFLFGGTAKITKLLKGKSLPAKLIRLSKTVGVVEKKSQSLRRAKDMPTQFMEELKPEDMLQDLSGGTL